MGEIIITRQDDSSAGRYVATIAGIAGEAELTWRHSRPGVIDADHTFAPESMRGTGVAGALVDRLIADARNEGLRIIPTCPYIRARYAKHPEWRDVMTEAKELP